MNKDRTKAYEIISHMLDNPDEHGIFPTSTAYNKLEFYMEQIRAETLGWAHADACVALDKGEDPRLKNIPEMLNRAKKDLK